LGPVSWIAFASWSFPSSREQIYDDYPDVALDMIWSRTFDGRIQLLECFPTTLAGPPGNQGVKD